MEEWKIVVATLILVYLIGKPWKKVDDLSSAPEGAKPMNAPPPSTPSNVTSARWDRLDSPSKERKRPLTIQSIIVYPVKGCKGVQNDSAVVEARGFRHDRRWMVTTSTYSFLSQRRISKMALVHPRVIEDKGNIILELSSKLMDYSIRVPVDLRFPKTCRVWDLHVDNCCDQGEVAARWLEECLGFEGCRLVYMSDEAHRPIKEKYEPRPTDETSLSDGFPYLVISQASLNDLNKRMKERVANNGCSPLKMDRFRPNIVLNGCEPYEEDRMLEIEVFGNRNVLFTVRKPCDRCKVTTIDQDKGIAPPSLEAEPLLTLQTFRKKGDNVYFGQNLLVSPDSFGARISRGDRFEFVGGSEANIEFDQIQ